MHFYCDLSLEKEEYHNKVYVKVKYVKTSIDIPLLPHVNLEIIEEKDFWGTPLSSKLIFNSDPTYKKQVMLADFLYKTIEAGSYGSSAYLFHGDNADFSTGSYALPQGFDSFYYDFTNRIEMVGTQFESLENEYRTFLLTYKDGMPVKDFTKEVESIVNNLSILLKEVSVFQSNTDKWLAMAITNLNNARLGTKVVIDGESYSAGSIVSLMEAYQSSIRGIENRIEMLLSGNYLLISDSNPVREHSGQNGHSGRHKP